jgi:hypothetical protein
VVAAASQAKPVLNPDEEDWRAWQSFLVQWGLVFTLMLIALVLLPYALKEMGYEVRVRQMRAALVSTTPPSTRRRMQCMHHACVSHRCSAAALGSPARELQ